MARFNTGKKAGNLKISHSFSIAQNSRLTALTFSPMPNDFPRLNPITRNFHAKNFFQEIQKNTNIFYFLQKSNVSEGFEFFCKLFVIDWGVRASIKEEKAQIASPNKIKETRQSYLEKAFRQWFDLGFASDCFIPGFPLARE